MSEKNKTILGYVPLLAALLVFIMMFLPAIVAKQPEGTVLDSISGAHVAFGHTEQLGLGFAFVVKMNFLAFLAFLLPLIVSIGIVVLTVLKKVEFLKIAKVVLALAFLLSIIGLFAILSTEVTIAGDVATFADSGNFALGAGSIIGAILSILALAAVGFDLFLDFKK